MQRSPSVYASAVPVQVIIVNDLGSAVMETALGHRPASLPESLKVGVAR